MDTLNCSESQGLRRWRGRPI